MARRDEGDRGDVPREREERDRKKRRKHKEHRRRASPSPDVRAGPKGHKRPPSSDDEGDRDGGAAKRHSSRDTVWIRVPRAALKGHLPDAEERYGAMTKKGC